MILDRMRLRTGLPAVPIATRPDPDKIVMHDTDDQRWASCTRCPWVSHSSRDPDVEAATHQTVACGPGSPR